MEKTVPDLIRGIRAKASWAQSYMAAWSKYREANPNAITNDRSDDLSTPIRKPGYFLRLPTGWSASLQPDGDFDLIPPLWLNIGVWFRIEKDYYLLGDLPKEWGIKRRPGVLTT